MTSLLPRGTAHTHGPAKRNLRVWLRKVAARSCSTRVQGSRLPKAAPLTSSPRVRPLVAVEHLRASHPTVGAHSCSTRVKGRRWACRRVRRQCRARAVANCSSVALPMVAAMFKASPVAPGPVRTQPRSPKGPRRALRRLAEARFCSTRARAVPRGACIRHHALAAPLPIGGPAAETRPPSRTDKRPGRAACGWRTCQYPPPPPPPTDSPIRTEPAPRHRGAPCQNQTSAKTHGPRQPGPCLARFVAEFETVGGHGDDHGVGPAGADVPVLLWIGGYVSAAS